VQHRFMSYSITSELLLVVGRQPNPLFGHLEAKSDRVSVSSLDQPPCLKAGKHAREWELSSVHKVFLDRILKNVIRGSINCAMFDVIAQTTKVIVPLGLNDLSQLSKA